MALAFAEALTIITGAVIEGRCNVLDNEIPGDEDLIR